MTETYQPPGNGAAGEPQLSSTNADANSNPTEPQQPAQDTHDGVANSVGNVADTEEELDGPGEPEDFADFTADAIARDLSTLKRGDDDLSRAAWMYRMRTFPRVRALKDKCGGPKFEAICSRELKLNKTYAHLIVNRLYTVPGTVQKLWNTVIGEAHQAKIRGDDYIYPATKTMLEWHKPPDDTEPADSPAPDTTGGNDPRTKGQILKSEIGLKDQALAYARDLVAEKAARAELARDHEIVSQRATDQSIDLRERVSREKDEHERELADRDRMLAEASAALAAAHAEIARLKALVPAPINDNGDDPNPPDNNNNTPDPVEPPAPEPEPPDPVAPNPEPLEPQVKRIKDVIGTENHPMRWGGKAKLIGGSRMRDRETVVAMRLRAYALLAHVPIEEARAGAAKLNPITSLRFFAQIMPGMELPTILNLPIPKTTAKE